MNKEEAILRDLLCKVLDGINKNTQLELSKTLGISLGMVNKTILKMSKIGAVRKEWRSFTVVDYKRMLLYWATNRNIEKDVVYSTRVNLPTREIERNLPDGILFTAYTGSRLSFGEAPSDYSEVWVYSGQELFKEIERRFPKNDLPANLIVLRKDSLMHSNTEKYSKNKVSVSIPQLYADLWNIPTWYSGEFVSHLERKMEEMRTGILE